MLCFIRTLLIMSSITLSLNVKARMLVGVESGFEKLSALSSARPVFGITSRGILLIVLVKMIKFDVNCWYSVWLGRMGDVQLEFPLFEIHG